MSDRINWGLEKCLPIHELVKEKLPVKRTKRTWNHWFERGVVINGQLHQLPQIHIAGVRHSSVSAIVAFFNASGAEPPPDMSRRKRRKKNG